MKARTVIAMLGLLVLPAALLPSVQTDAGAPEEDQFSEIWSRLDLPVTQGQADRSWVWGPAAISDVMVEPSAGDRSAVREIQYFEKGRIEVRSSDAADSEVEILQGAPLVLDLIDGTASNRTASLVDLSPAEIPIAGDEDSPGSIQYADIGDLIGLDPYEEGETVVIWVDSNAEFTVRDELAGHGVVAGSLVAGSGHRLASVFDEFLRSSGQVWDGDSLTSEPIFRDALSLTGLPITEAYWVSVSLRGETQDVLVQCFERRCMTFTPGNPKNWQVEFTNTGDHYFGWIWADQDEGDLPQDPLLPVASFTSDEGITHTMSLEVAATDATRACGLMHRDSLPDNGGMLFVWDHDLAGGFWNCNTFVPLTLAWIDVDGVILGFSDMRAQTRGQPQELQTYPPPDVYRYVIEANQGWFDEREISAGSTVDLADALARGDTNSDTLCQQFGLACQ